FAKKLGENAGAPTSGSVAFGVHYGYRMTEPIAAIGLAQLENLPQYIRFLKKNAGYYDQAVKGCRWLRLQRRPEEADHTFYHWAATFEGEAYGIGLDDFKNAVEKANISSISIGYTRIPAYQHPLIKNRAAHAFDCSSYKGDRDHYPEGLCPIAERIIPRIVLAYVIEPEEMAKREAEKLHQVIEQLEKSA
ncbi:MAG: DegT/DnrJ/EryC1/StrS family aminotransferase, partial [Candidatus Latescibacteria bacterium]|nr:DegT/DnrJ/EryC1/StrS family aminotransferase [Candidatus Latescibacterota bacterium]